MSEDKKSDTQAVTDVNEALFAAMSMEPTASKEMQTAKAIAVLHAAIRRLPEQQSPARCQQETTHRYI